MSNLIIKSYPSINSRKTSKREVNFINENINISKELLPFCINKKAYIKTQGCQANYRDSEHIRGILLKCGFSMTENIDDADLILINTCAVRENAENKALSNVGNLKRHKKGKDLTIIITGCMAMEEVIVDQIVNIYKNVSLVISTNIIHKLPDLLLEHYKYHKRIIDVEPSNYTINENLPSSRDSNFKAFVNITYGCDNFCTYCIVPYTRGIQRSRNKEDIIKECKCLINEGYKEITLLGQNVDTYGLDLKPQIKFATLLDEVASLNIPRLTFLTSHPFYFSLDIIDVMNKHENILKYIHLPIQSGDDNILKLMGRKYNSKQYLDLIKGIRAKSKDIAISTDIIVGFPNETEVEFNNSLNVIKEVNYDSAFTFIYSKRSGTPASKMEDNVTYKEKVSRFKKLTNLLGESIIKNNQKYIGNVYDVLVDSISKNDEDFLTGRLNTNKIVNFKGSKDLVGEIVKVKITSEHLHYLLGELAETQK